MELLPRRGFQVAPLTGEDIRDLFVALALLSGETAARAAARLTPEGLAELEALRHEVLAAARRGDHPLLRQKNDAVHAEIDRIANARKLTWIQSLIGPYGAGDLYETIEGWPEATETDHGAILAALPADRGAAGGLRF